MSRSRALLALALFIVASVVGVGRVASAGEDASPGVASLPMAKPEEVGMSTERLERFTEIMDGYVERGELAGAVTLVARHGKVVYLRASGSKYREGGEPMTEDTIFRIASMTKPIVSVALMMLYEEGRFLLDDPISNWLPEYAEPMVAERAPDDERVAEPYKLVPARRPITVRHVLTHTAGLANSYRGMTRELLREANADVPRTTVRDQVRREAAVPLNFHPGEDWEYGGATNHVGVLVEEISGSTLDEFLRKRIFEPLRMHDTHFNVPEGKVSRMAALYRPDEQGKAVLADAPAFREPTQYFSGAGGLSSTAADYWRFSQMLVNGGELDGARILSRRTIDLMISNHIGDSNVWLMGPGYKFGLGFRVLVDPGKAWEHLTTGSFGWGGAFNTYFFVDPNEDMIGISMTQIRPYTHLDTRAQLGILATQAIVDSPAGARPVVKPIPVLD
jgi:CubicO group peptidase (beta-lactamase class C family)